MKYMYMFLVLVFLLPLSAAAQEDEAPVLTGPLTVEQILDLPGWFGEEFLAYQPDPDYRRQIREYTDSLRIVCILGTWCSDSKREVPRMLRLMQLTAMSPERMTMIGVDRDKMSPGGEAAIYGVDRVPTFIFFRDGKELGRIVEAPFASLEKDMLGILMHPVKDSAAPDQVGSDVTPPDVTGKEAVKKQGSGAQVDQTEHGKER